MYAWFVYYFLKGVIFLKHASCDGSNIQIFKYSNFKLRQTVMGACERPPPLPVTHITPQQTTHYMHVYKRHFDLILKLVDTWIDP